jgi:hypothetical protein
MKWKYLIIPVFILLSCDRTFDSNEILKYYGDAKEDIGSSIAIADDGYYICGQLTEITRSPENRITKTVRKMGLIKTGFDGNTIWEKSFGDTLAGSGSKVLTLDDGSVICAGQVTVNSSTLDDIIVVRLNSDGSDITQKVFKTSGNQSSTDILQTSEGFLLLGTTDISRTPLTDSTGNKAGKKDILIMRLDPDLNQIGSIPGKGFPNDDYGAAIIPDGQNGFVIAGTTDRSEEAGQGNNNILLLRINVFGNDIGKQIIGTSAGEYVSDIEPVDDGYLITGTINRETSAQNIFLTKVPKDISQVPVFTKTIGDSKIWSVNAMSRYRNNYFVLAGKKGYGSASDLLVCAIDEDGNLIDGKEKSASTDGIQILNDVASDTDGNVIAVGKNTFETNSMITLLKFRF